jgi:hypothetical protein
LLEILVDQAEARRLVLVPPRIVTAGQLPEILYEAQRPVANALTQQLAWVEALRHTDTRLLAHLTRHLPADHDLFAWLAFGELLAALHDELAGEGLTFADVATRGETLAAFHESARWHALAAIQGRYLQALEAHGLWDQPTARLRAIDHGACRTGYDIILVGTVDLNATQRAMLNQVKDRVTALIFAPPALADRFDAYGCVVAPAWQEVQIDLEAADIAMVDSPSDQADAVVRTLARFNGAFAADDITIGVPDVRIVPYIQQRLAAYGLPLRYGAGTPVTSTSPCRLLRAVAAYLDNNSFAAFANLVRHPALEQWLATQGIASDWLSALDDYYNTHLPARVNGQWWSAPRPQHRLQPACAALESLLAPMQSEARQPHEWTVPILALVLEVYGHSPLHSDDEAQRTSLVACEHLQQAAHEHLQVHESLAPRISGAAALRLVLQALEDVTVPPRFDQAAIELLGWLELPLDDAPALIVTGFSEGYVPASQSGELFLPEMLRSHLGLPDNARRYARDAYNLAMLAASRARLTLIAGRRTPDNDVLLPSCLLFACDDDRLLSRTLAAFSPPRPSRRQPGWSMLQPGRASGGFDIPRPVPLPAPVTSMRVTEFRDYLACPYRYYLRHHLQLQTVETTAEELDPATFGVLLHEVLGAFAVGPAAVSHSAAEIRAALHSTLDARIQQSFGAESLPAVRVQVEQARWRLDRFADWQADWARQGWRIEYAEPLVAGKQSWLLVDGVPMYLRGRIDRIDVHAATQERIIFDYKTGDTVREPNVVHRTPQRDWVDVQLPLYRHLVSGLGINDDVRLGYILLPKAIEETGACLAPWTPEELAQADHAAAEVVRHVRAEKFWPPSPGPFSYDDFAVICQVEQFGTLPTHPLEHEDGARCQQRVHCSRMSSFAPLRARARRFN